MRAALVHDWLTGMRGGEKVLELLCELLPGSDIYTLIHVPGTTSPRIEEHRIAASWLNRLPGVRRYYRYLLPFMPGAARRLRVSGYDLVVAVSHCVAHGIDAAGSTKLVAYYLTPMRYAWDHTDAYFPRRRWLDPRYLAFRLFRSYLRAWDRAAAARPQEVLCISEAVRERIRRCYGRDARVVYPPVDTDFYRPADTPREDFYLWVGALAPYKRIDLAVEAFRRLGRHLVVIGTGQEYRAARRNAPPNVSFLGFQPDARVRDFFRRARALVFPGEEDFGIVPLEAQACGTPVIAYDRGGARETVVDVRADASAPTGVLFATSAVESLLEAIGRFEANADAFATAALRNNALRFSRAAASRALKEFLAQLVARQDADDAGRP